jgi:hypothetical protein
VISLLLALHSGKYTYTSACPIQNLRSAVSTRARGLLSSCPISCSVLPNIPAILLWFSCSRVDSDVKFNGLKINGTTGYRNLCSSLFFILCKKNLLTESEELLSFHRHQKLSQLLEMWSAKWNHNESGSCVEMAAGAAAAALTRTQAGPGFSIS